MKTRNELLAHCKKALSQGWKYVYGAKCQVLTRQQIKNLQNRYGKNMVWDSDLNKAKFNIQGFRRGHAPRNVIEKTYGQGVFVQDALDDVFYLSYKYLYHYNILPFVITYFYILFQSFTFIIS